MLNQSEKSYTGIDVSKATLDVFILPNEKHFQFPNTPNGIEKLTKKLSLFPNCYVVMEATGGLEKFRFNWSTILKNIALALTGVGALFIGAHLVMTKIRHHHARFPFSKSQTTTMQKIGKVKEAAHKISPKK